MWSRHRANLVGASWVPKPQELEAPCAHFLRVKHALAVSNSTAWGLAGKVLGLTAGKVTGWNRASMAVHHGSYTPVI
jgi:hypothetical protein